MVLFFPMVLAILLSASSPTSPDEIRLRLIARLASAPAADLEAEFLSAIPELKRLGGGVPVVPVAVIGGGLSGLTASLHLLEQGVSVTLIDKASFFGGNSAKASSGVNGCVTDRQAGQGINDTLQRFHDDTLRSSQRSKYSYTGKLVEKMTDGSKEAVEWIQSRANVDLPDVGQMGGHTAPRTHRPRGRLSGAAFISGLERAVMKFEAKGLLTVHKSTALTGIERVDDNSWRLALAENEGGAFDIMANSVIIATGGFSADRSEGGLLNEVAPHLVGLATTNGAFATGDGVKIARSIGAQTVDLDMVQVHPTGFSDVPRGFKDPDGTAPLILAAEIMRGVGGVLLAADGKRFVDELGTRKDVTARMNETGQENYLLVIPPEAAEKVEAHIRIYTGKGLLHKVSGARGVAEYLAERYRREGDEDVTEVVEKTFRETTAGEGVPRGAPTVLPAAGDYHVGVVQPVLHYTMGGLKIDAETATVLGEGDKPLEGLYAAGETIGGVHGVNRLGGSSLLDCIVFGLLSGRAAAERARTVPSSSSSRADTVRPAPEDAKAAAEPAAVTLPPPGERVMVKISDDYYEMSAFLGLHPGGAIEVKDGEDLTPRFTGAHGKDWELLERKEVIGPLDENGSPKAKKPKEEHHLANYGGKGGSWREIVGRHSWFLIHSIAAKYPEYPTKADKEAMRGFVATLGQLYPCKLCRKHLQQQLRDPELGPVALENRTALTVWMCKLHNIVNKDIGKPLFSCNPLELDLMYLKNCGECEPEKKDKTAFNPALLSGFHPESGPWDHELYMKNPRLLQDVVSKNDLWQYKQTQDVADLLVKMKAVKEKNKGDLLQKLLSDPQLQKSMKGLIKESAATIQKALSA